MRPITEAKKQQVIRLLKDGHSQNDIVARAGVGNGTVSRISKSLTSSRPKSKGGRPPLLTRREKNFCVLEITRGKKANAVQLKSSLEEEFGVKASAATVRRALKESGLMTSR